MVKCINPITSLFWGLFEAKTPSEKRRIQERERQFREAAKGSTSLQGWLRKSQPAADEEEQSQASRLCEENVDQEEAHRAGRPK